MPEVQVPSGYGPAQPFKWRRWIIPLNVIAFLALAPFFSTFAGWLSLIRPDIHTLSFKAEGWNVLLALLALLVLIWVGVILHEAIHGAAFWAFSQKRPVFGLRLFYAFAASPGNYFSKGAMATIALAPLFVMSIVGLGLCVILPKQWLLPILLILVTNASGAVGDITFCLSILAKPSAILIRDWGDGMDIHLPIEEES